MAKAIITVFLILLTLGTARAEVESRYVDGPAFASLDAAAVAALVIAMQQSDLDSFEHGGILFEYDDLYYYTEPVTSGHKHKVEYHGMLPNNAELAGTYHSHPTTVRFSDSDIRGAKDRRIPSYLGIVSSRMVKVYIPGFKDQFLTVATLTAQTSE